MKIILTKFEIGGRFLGINPKISYHRTVIEEQPKSKKLMSKAMVSK